MLQHKNQNGSRAYSPPVKHYSATYDGDSGITSNTVTGSSRNSSSRHISAAKSSVTRKVRPKSATSYELLARDTSRLTDLQHTLDNSECRRRLITQKLWDAKDTIEKQAHKINKIENTTKDKTLYVDELMIKEKDYKRKIGSLKRDNCEYQSLTLDTLRAKNNLQQQVGSLDVELKSIQSSYNLLQREALRKQINLDKSTSSLTALDKENAHLVKAKESMSKEMSALKESLEITRCKNNWLESQHKDTKTEIDTLRQENRNLTTEVKGMIRQQSELKHTNSRLRDSTTSLETNIQMLTQDKQKLTKQIDCLQESVADMRITLDNVTADKERYFHETLELHRCTQAIAYEKDNMERIKMSLTDQLNEANVELTKVRSEKDRSKDDMRKLEEELMASKKVGEMLSTELAGVKSRLEVAQEQLAVMEGTKALLLQKHQLTDKETGALQEQLEQMKQAMHDLTLDRQKAQDSVQQEVGKVKEELRQVKLERNQFELTAQQLSQKLNDSNEAWQKTSREKEAELETWKNSSQKLSASSSRKDLEILAMNRKLQDLEDKLSEQKTHHISQQKQVEELAKVRDNNNSLQEENRRLIQERAENQQMIQLLELQKSILTKTAEGALNRDQNTIQMQCQVEQLKTENGLLKDKMKELEESQMHLDSGRSEEYEVQLSEIRTQNEQTTALNSMLMEQLNRMEQENSSLRAKNKECLPRIELERVENEKAKLTINCSRLQAENKSLEEQCNELVREKATRQRLEATRLHEKQENGHEEKKTLCSEIAAQREHIDRLQQEKHVAEATSRDTQQEVTSLQQQIATCQEEYESEMRVLRKQMDLLQLALEDAQSTEKEQKNIIENLKQEMARSHQADHPVQIAKSLEDASVGLNQMKTELQRLMEMMTVKDTTIEDLESKLQKLGNDNKKLREEENSLDEFSSMRKQKQELRRQVASLTQERDEALQDAASLRVQLADLQRNLTGSTDGDLYSRQQKELRAKDRQIESLEEQLQRYTNGDIRKLRRDAGKVELLQGENRRLQNQLSIGPAAKATESDDQSDAAEDEDENAGAAAAAPSWLRKYTVAAQSDEDSSQAANDETEKQLPVATAPPPIVVTDHDAVADDDGKNSESKSDHHDAVANGNGSRLERSMEEEEVNDTSLDSSTMRSHIPRHRHSSAEHRYSTDSSPSSVRSSGRSYRTTRRSSPSSRIRSSETSSSSRALLRSTERLLRDSDKLLSARSSSSIYSTSARPYGVRQYRPSREFTESSATSGKRDT